VKEGKVELKRRKVEQADVIGIDAVVEAVRTALHPD